MKKKKLSLNSYFKKRDGNGPDSISEIVSYFMEHHELPFEYDGNNWIYDTLIEYQKHYGVENPLIMTPDKVAQKVAEKAVKYRSQHNFAVNACCGTGQITSALIQKDFELDCFDMDKDLIDIHKMLYPTINAQVNDFRESKDPLKLDLIISHPPFDVKLLQNFFEWLYKAISCDGVAILILPRDFIDKKRPKALANVLSVFKVKERETIREKIINLSGNTEIIIIELTEKEKEMKRNLPAVINTENNLGNTQTVEPIKVVSLDKDNNAILDNPEAIHEIELSKIDLNPFNPRKFHNEADLNDLATSIKNFGVIQPITLRPKNNGERYEIVCGERRYRASIIAGKTYIPSIVKQYSDGEAMEVTIIENLQRIDISPIEEAQSFEHLMAYMEYTIEDLSNQFGKSDTYIRTRLQLRNLIDDIAMMVIKNEISLGNAIEISKYNHDIQADVYTAHLDEDDHYCWRKLTTKEFKIRLENNYSSDLSKYYFDKSKCMGCPFNSATYDLFAQEGECGVCQNSACLKEKQNEFIVKSTTELAVKEENAQICVSPSSGITSDLTDKIKEMGFDINEVNTYKFPETPIAPEKDNFLNEEEFKAANEKFKNNIAEYTAQMEHIQSQISEGKAVKVININGNKPVIGYRTISEGEEKPKEVNPLNKLRGQDKRNKEIAYEKTVEGVKQFIRKQTFPESEFSEMEENLLLFVMLKNLREDHKKLIGIKDLWNDEEKAKVILKLSPSQKDIIRRDFITSHLSETFGVKKQSELFLQFASLHFPEEVAGIQKEFYDIYEKRHASIKKRMEELKSLAKKVKGEELEETAPQGEVETTNNIKVNTSDKPIIEQVNAIMENLPEVNHDDDFSHIETQPEEFNGNIIPETEPVRELVEEIA